jgi:hypothetical protein
MLFSVFFFIVQGSLSYIERREFRPEDRRKIQSPLKLSGLVIIIISIN